MFNTSVCSYPARGSWGNNKYRGNCTGYIVKDFIESYRRDQNGLVADPSVGGGSSEDVARDLGVRFKGTDLHQGFNLLRDDFRSHLGEDAHLVWWHPPYWDMIRYSGNVWGEMSEPNPWDMSQMDLPEFVEALELAIMNIHDACERGGHYGILMGNLRREGRYYNLSSLVERVTPGRLVDEIIKVQHNCTSDRRSYSGRLIRIAHEKLLVFRRDNGSSLIFLMDAKQKAKNMVSTTWRAAVRRVLQGNTMKLDEIYEKIKPFAESKQNNHWQAKVRQILQDSRYFNRVETGVYALAS